MVLVSTCNSPKRDVFSVIHDRFEVFVGGLETAYGVSLARPHFRSVGDIKGFCCGLIEGQRNHPWKSDFSRCNVSSRSRMSIAHSLFLFRKLIPNEKPQVGAYVERMCVPSQEPDPVFLDFCRRMTRKIFPVGWDRSYQDKCSTSVLPITSCYENGRKHGGCRGVIEGMGLVNDRIFPDPLDRESFVSYVSESVAPKPRGVSRVQAVLAGDKWRVVSIPPVWDNALRPFHQCLYDFVSSKKWVLRGDAKPASFKGFSRVDGEKFVSGDYESATDNLNSEVQLAILTELVMRSRTIPRGLALHALDSFNSLLDDGERVRQQRRGQLMGQLLSFPLLCLINYITFKYCVPRDVPVIINGDDIVFRAREDEADRWREKVGESGLVLSAGKTMVHRRFFSLNSCMFDAGKASVKFVPFVRPKALWGSGVRECEKIASLGPRYGSFLVGFGAARKRLFQTIFLRENVNTILRSRRSLTRGLEMKVSEESLRASGLWSRELYYLEGSTEPPLPRMSFSQLACNDLPEGWVQVSRHWYPPEVIKGWSYRLGIEMCRSAWTRAPISESDAEKKWMQRCDEGVSTWGMKDFGHFKRSLLRLSRRQFWRWRCIRENRDLFGRVQFSRGKGVWMPGTPKSVVNNSEEKKEFEYLSYPPPLILTDPGWFDREDRMEAFIQ